jgi:hypothetical protein
MIAAIHGASGICSVGCARPVNAQQDAIEAIAMRWSGASNIGAACRAVDVTVRRDNVREVCVYRAVSSAGTSDTILLRRHDAAEAINVERALRGTQESQLTTALQSTERDFESHGYETYVCTSSLSEPDTKQQIIEWRSEA